MTNDDWAAAEAEYMREERERLGGPPTPEQISALLRGELSETEAARVRALAVYYPALTDVLLAKEPSDDGVPLSRDELEGRWESLQRRLPKPGVRHWLPLVAMLMVGFVAGLIVPSFRRDLPRTFGVSHELHPLDVRRGTAEGRPHLLRGDEREYLLVLMLGRDTGHRHYRIDIIAPGSSSKVIWRSPAMARVESRPFTIAVPRTFLDPGTYRVELYGLDGEPNHLASYLVRVTE
jgi:hypothetical protein